MTVASVSLLLFGGCTGEGEPEHTGVLVSGEWLEDHLSDPDLVVLHSGSAERYDSTHIPGARLISPYDFIVDTESLRNEMPSIDSLEALLRSVGVDNESRIVLYNENSKLLTRTARVFVALDYLGLGDRTFVLNGGLHAWEEEERETSNVAMVFSPGNLQVGSSKDVIIEAAQLDQQRWSADYVVIDARSHDEYYGTPSTMESPAEGGHIEGANLLTYQDLLDDSAYRLRSDEELKKIFHKAGMDLEKVTVVYCGSGIRASVSYLAARHLQYQVLLYDGSYGEWEELKMTLTGPVDIPVDFD